MKILATQSAILSNHEVLLHLEEVRTRYASRPDYSSKNGAKFLQLHSIVTDTLSYLTTSITPLATYTSETARTLITRLAPYGLTKGEVLMLLNQRPRDLTNLDPLVEEMHERFTSEQHEEIMVIVAEVLGVPEEVEEEAEGNGEGMEVDGR